ncbi:MAG: hypothetical protein P8101_23230 [Candidatus Thiodiazotropha sp.]
MTTSVPENYATGQLAQQELQLRLPLQVCHSHMGYYIGTLLEGLPCSRESVEYYSDHHSAYKALETKSWTQRLSA